MSDEQIPGWARGLIESITVLNERLPNHIAYAERNISDHEDRLRAMETTQASLASTVERIVKIEENETEIFNRIRLVEKKTWMFSTGVIIIVAVIGWITSMVGNGLTIGG